jgi:hypothetical protein
MPKKKLRTCRCCKQPGHNSRTCPYTPEQAAEIAAAVSIPLSVGPATLLDSSTPVDWQKPRLVSPVAPSASASVVAPEQGGGTLAEGAEGPPSSSDRFPESTWTVEASVEVSTKDGDMTVAATVEIDGQLSLGEWLAGLDGAHVARWLKGGVR